jgi:hypothetical protein
MLGSAAVAKIQSRDRGFQWRGHEISRIEGLSDAVFAFAVTLLIVSLEVPRTFAELWETIRGFLPFAISFGMLIQIWYIQFTWFRRYALQDTITVALNTALLFVVLFYVYPLKFLFTFLVSEILGGGGMAHFHDGHVEPMLKGNDVYLMMLVYNAGFIAVFVVFVLLYGHAWRKRNDLGLDAGERFRTKEQLGANACFVVIGLVSTSVVLVGGPHTAGLAGMVYMLIAPTLTAYYYVMGRRFQALVIAPSEKNRIENQRVETESSSA